MKILIAAILFNILFFGFSASSQTKTKQKNLAKQKVDKRSPSVYVTMDGSKGASLKVTGLKSGIVWFLLHNNLNSPIRFCTYDSTISPTGKSGIAYDIETEWDFSKETPPEPPRLVSSFPASDSCINDELASGKSFSFGVPKKQFQERSRLRLSFNYAWEVEKDILLGLEVQHFVYFSVSRIP